MIDKLENIALLALVIMWLLSIAVLMVSTLQVKHNSGANKPIHYKLFGVSTKLGELQAQLADNCVLSPFNL